MLQRTRVDWWLLASVFGLLVFGLLVVWSATQYVAPPRFAAPEDTSATAISVAGSRTFRQAGWAVVGVVLMMILRRVNYRRLNHPAWALSVMALAICLVVLAYFLDRRDHRFLRAGLIGLQPSEVGKPALVVFLAHFIAARGKTLNDPRTLAPAAAILALACGAVAVADLGTAIVMIVTAAVVFFVAGLEWRYFRLAALLGFLLVAVAVAIRPYRMARLVAFLDPEMKVASALGIKEQLERHLAKSRAARDPRYQVRQSLIGLGSGGLFGLGLMQGEHKFGFVPEAQNDFIYAVVGEETGLAGCTAVLAAFVIILWRGLRAANHAVDEFGRYIALGVTSLVIFQALVNMSVVLGLLPTKGISLPMISYGGSSLAATMSLFGLLLSVSERGV